MIYDYRCMCGARFEVIKSMHDAAREEMCPQCGETGERVFSPPFLNGTKVFEASYYPSLGKVIHNRRELRDTLDRRNLVEIGNDFSSGESMQKHFEEKRAYDQEKKWESLKI